MGIVGALTGLGYGVASAFVPLINAEAYAIVAARQGSHAVVLLLALALGQTVGKLLLFESARRGSGWLTSRITRTRHASARTGRWVEPVQRWLSCRRTGLPTVFVSAVVGLPPLALVSLAAGAANLRRWEFAAACLLGRAIRFVLLALPVMLRS
ncbi:MAG TPA: VTT domain-containing protein [Micromonosporaceae bacterium]|jgi:membrane protein YqaA with SNARE-associated domain